MTDVTRELAQFVAVSRWEDVPAAVRREGRRAVLNWLGCALGGCRDATMEPLLAALGAFAGPPQATAIGRGERYDALTAACVNGVASNILDFDDTHMRTVIHPTVPVASALLALAEWRPMDGRRFLHAFVLGVDVECRVGNALSPGLFDAGWHPTSVCGGIGAAAACSRALGLDAGRTAWALGLAATQACGLSEVFGTMGKSFNIGHAARSGLAAAMLAAAGFTASARGIESPRGLAGVFGDPARAHEALAGLGAEWELAGVGYKPYPCGIVTHPVIDACLDLRQAHGLQAGRIARVELAVDPVTLGVCGRDPADGLAGKLSLSHCAAAALLDGEVGVPQFSDARVAAGDAAALRARVAATADAALGKGQARVRVVLDDGACHDMAVEHARGTPRRPLTDAELERKFQGLAALAGLDPSAIGRTLADCRALDELPDAGALARTGIPPNS
ncbi:MmgE/PrpD family protein [Pigmentiphaga soli]|uniref:MmgE/PrpD family protein n=1 Tax=Pigmentiphaga soli TaxID=1007095 RepID=A0ABP8HS80_9BURK